MTECIEEAKNEESLDDIIDACFSAAKDHWMATEEDDQFLGAVGAILQLSNDEDEEKMRAELDTVKALNAAMSGVPVDFSAVPSLRENPICLHGRWKKQHGPAI